MTFLALDGFDNYSFATLASGWQGGSPFSNPPGRIDGTAISVIAENGIYQDLNPAIVGFAFKNNSDPGWFGTGGPICFRLSSLQTCGDPSNLCPGSPLYVDFIVGIGLDAGNRPFIYTASWIDAGTCPGHPTKCDLWEPASTTFYGWGETPALHYDEWNYLEINFETLELRLNGETIVTSSSTATTHGTVYSQSGIADDRIYLTVPHLNNNISFDDFYAQDNDGDFVGDIHIETLYPDADGHYTQWTPGPGGSGTDHYTRVDETVMDGDKSYNYDATPGDRDSYLMQAMSVASGTVYATQLNLAVKTNGELLGNNLNPFIRQGGTDYDGPNTFLSPYVPAGSSEYKYASYISDTDPTGAPWTVTTVNDDEYGVKLVT